jgi:hypothetical protein
MRKTFAPVSAKAAAKHVERSDLPTPPLLFPTIRVAKLTRGFGFELIVVEVPEQHL